MSSLAWEGLGAPDSSCVDLGEVVLMSGTSARFFTLQQSAKESQCFGDISLGRFCPTFASLVIMGRVSLTTTISEVMKFKK